METPVVGSDLCETSYATVDTEKITVEIVPDSTAIVVAEYVFPNAEPLDPFTEIINFVKERGHASCFEMMKEFHLSYSEAVSHMNILEQRGVVDSSDPYDGEDRHNAPRPLMTDARRKKREEQRLEREAKASRDKIEKEEERKREQEKKPEPASVAKQPVPEMRKRVTRRARH